MRQAISTAPRNGVFVILEDEARGALAVARWSAEAAQWLDDEGAPVQLNATHWHLAQTIAAPVNNIDPLADPRICRDTPGGMTAQAQGTATPANFRSASTSLVGGGIVRRRRSILTLAACLLVGAAIGPLLYHDYLGEFLLSQEVASESETGSKHALRQEQELATKIVSDAPATRHEAEAQAALLHQTEEPARREKETADRTIAQLRQALQIELTKVDKLVGELAAAQQEVEANAAAARTASDEARLVVETNKRKADEQGQALREAQGKAEKLTAELMVTRQEVETLTAAVRAARDEARRMAEASKRSADEQGQVLRDAQDKAEKLGTELAVARREVQSQVSVANSAKDQAAGAREVAERSANEQRRALQQERDKTDKLATELTEAKSSLEMQAKVRAAEEVARENQLVAMRGELQKAKAEVTAARESLEAERARTQWGEQQLVAIQESTAGRNSGLRSVALSTVDRPSTAPLAAPAAPTKPAVDPEPGNPQAVRLIARANLLLEQGNIVAARNMLDRAMEMGSAEALFWLAQTYDPLLLSMRQTFGTQSDIAKARELYGKALAGGVVEAKVRLEALQQRTGAQ